MIVRKQGFIIPLTLMLISVAMVIITTIYQRGSLFVPFSSTMIKREQAKELALSGIQVAMSQLAQIGAQEEKKEGDQGVAAQKESPAGQEKKTESKEKKMLAQLLPLLNQWQEFPLKKDNDGIDGSITIAIACEHGKIDLNAIYDFSKKKFRGEGEKQGDWKKIMQGIFTRVAKEMGLAGKPYEAFERFMKGRQAKLNDATEFLQLDEFKDFADAIFYQQRQSGVKAPAVYLLDLFTVYGGNSRIQPWFFSDSVRSALGMKRVTALDPKKGNEVVQGWIKNMKPSVNWAKDWNQIFQPMYGVEYQRLPKGIDAVFETSFDPRLFSVVSYGVVGSVTQRAYAIIERIRKTEKNKSWYDVQIRKFYWI